MMACVAALVWVMWQATCGVAICRREEGEGSWRVVAMLHLEI